MPWFTTFLISLLFGFEASVVQNFHRISNNVVITTLPSINCAQQDHLILNGLIKILNVMSFLCKTSKNNFLTNLIPLPELGKFIERRIMFQFFFIEYNANNYCLFLKIHFILFQYGILLGVAVSLLFLLYPWARPSIKVWIEETYAYFIILIYIYRFSFKDSKILIMEI